MRPAWPNRCRRRPICFPTRSNRSCSIRLAHHAVAHGAPHVPTLSYRAIDLDEFLRKILLELDGVSSHRQIIDRLTDLALQGKLQVRDNEGQLVRDREMLLQVLTEVLDV